CCWAASVTAATRAGLADSAEPARVAAVTDAAQQQALALFQQIYRQENGRQTRLSPGVSEVLAVLAEQGIALAVVTNKPLQFTEPLLRQLGLAEFFQIVVGGNCLPQRKPHPLPLLHVCERLGVPPAQGLMVGDSRNDVDAAK